MLLAYPPKIYLSTLNWPLKIVIFILKKIAKIKNAHLENIECSNQKTQLVSYIFLDSEQLLTYAYPPKMPLSTPQKTFWDTLRTLEATKYFFFQPDQSVIVTTSME